MVDEQRLKAMAQREYENAKSSGIVGSGGYAQGLTEPMRESLTGGLRNRLDRSRQEARKADRLEELLALLDKNPEIARILDLVDSVGKDY